ncbi:MAG: ARMT1-like domain-containing protein [Candidatus Lokiarchaeia archaeon]|nr:ARMT1-like domain-containing protein [Candidatus Lokiarchaeia archaeon]
MKLEPECIGCLFNQMLNAFRLLKPDFPRKIIIKAQKELMEYLINFDIEQRAAPYLGKITYNIISDLLKDNDPYYNLKMQYNSLVMKYFGEIVKIIESADDSLSKAILASALGNTIDFASQHEIDIINDVYNFAMEDLVINDYVKFRKSLDNTTHLLILGDNAGEIVFDKILILILKKYYPDLEIVYSVRSKPIINDATLEDAKFISLTDLVEVIESNDAPGIILSEATEKFKKHFFKENGVILSKGQGNFESLYGMEIPQKEVYYLLKAKCNLMERIFTVKIGDLIFKKKNIDF